MSLPADTIFALATAPGRAGVAVLRISGSNAGAVFPLFGMMPPIPRLATLCALSHDQHIVDEALVLWFPAPHSFTGEDVVELHLHGSRAVLQEVSEILSSLPHFRPADAGEFSRRAFLNGKMDLTEVEALADLIDAETRAQKQQALRQMQGVLGQFYEGFRSRIIKSLAHLEAYIDFPDEDIPASVLQEIRGDIDALLEDICRHLNDARQGEKLREGLYATIIGPPNAGKSSLMNWLAGRDVAIVSSIAGTTRDVIEVHLELAGYPLILADTAGLRDSTDIIEEEGIRRARAHAAEADIKIALFDATALPSLDEATLKLVDENTLVLINKQDAAAATLPTSIGNCPALAVSVTRQQGLDQLLQELSQRISERFTPSPSAVITRARHRSGLQNAAQHLQTFLNGWRSEATTSDQGGAQPSRRLSANNMPIELMCEELRLAASAIGKITGRIDVEDILDEIFRSFCIGK